MLTSPEVKAELEKAGWVLTFAGSVGVQWDHPKAAVTVLCNGQHCFDGDFTPIFQFCAIAGIAPQGYAIVPTAIVEFFEANDEGETDE